MKFSHIVAIFSICSHGSVLAAPTPIFYFFDTIPEYHKSVPAEQLPPVTKESFENYIKYTNELRLPAEERTIPKAKSDDILRFQGSILKVANADGKALLYHSILAHPEIPNKYISPLMLGIIGSFVTGQTPTELLETTKEQTAWTSPKAENEDNALTQDFKSRPSIDVTRIPDTDDKESGYSLFGGSHRGERGLLRMGSLKLGHVGEPPNSPLRLTSSPNSADKMVTKKEDGIPSFDTLDELDAYMEKRRAEKDEVRSTEQSEAKPEIKVRGMKKSPTIVAENSSADKTFGTLFGKKLKTEKIKPPQKETIAVNTSKSPRPPKIEQPNWTQDLDYNKKMMGVDYGSRPLTDLI